MPAISHLCDTRSVCVYWGSPLSRASTHDQACRGDSSLDGSWWIFGEKFRWFLCQSITPGWAGYQAILAPDTAAMMSVWCGVMWRVDPDLGALNTRQRWWGMAASPGVRAQSMTQHPVARLPYHVKRWPSSETILYEMMHALYYNKGMRLLRTSTSKVLRNCERFILANT